MNQVSKYFNAEKDESLLFIIVGIAALILAIYFLAIVMKSYFNGIAYSILAIGILQIVVGTTVYRRSPKDIVRMEQYLKSDSPNISTEEIPRMKAVMANFFIYKMIEISLIILGILLLFYIKYDLTKGIGLGLVLQSCLMLIFDLFAEQRGKAYMNFLESIA